MDEFEDLKNDSIQETRFVVTEFVEGVEHDRPVLVGGLAIASLTFHHASAC